MSTQGVGWAQTDEERAGARAAATEGAKAFREKRWVDAADLFARAESLMHAPPHLLYLGRAQLNLGQLVKAQEAFLKIQREHLEPSAPKPFRDAQAESAKDLTGLEARIPSVKVAVQGADGKTVKVTMDGNPVPSALVGLQRPVDPGEHRFQATGEGLSSDVATVMLKEGARESVTLLMRPTPGATLGAPATANGTDALAPTAQPLTTTPAPTASMTASADSGAASGGGVNGYVVGSIVSYVIGAGGIVTGIIMLSKAKSKDDEAGDVVKDGSCTEGADCDNRKAQLADLESQRDSARTLGTVGLAVGGVGVVVGTTLLLLNPGSEKKSSARSERPLAPSLEPWVGWQSFGLRGSF